MGGPVSATWRERLFAVDNNGESMFVLASVRSDADGLVNEICVRATDGKVALKGDGVFCLVGTCESCAFCSEPSSTREQHRR